MVGVEQRKQGPPADPNAFDEDRDGDWLCSFCNKAKEFTKTSHLVGKTSVNSKCDECGKKGDIKWTPATKKAKVGAFSFDSGSGGGDGGFKMDTGFTPAAPAVPAASFGATATFDSAAFSSGGFGSGGGFGGGGFGSGGGFGTVAPAEKSAAVTVDDDTEVISAPRLPKGWNRAVQAARVCLVFVLSNRALTLLHTEADHHLRHGGC